MPSTPYGRLINATLRKKHILVCKAADKPIQSKTDKTSKIRIKYSHTK